MLGSLSQRRLTLLALAFGALCAILAFTRPDGGWEWVPAISGLAFFGTLAGRRVTRAPGGFGGTIMTGVRLYESLTKDYLD